MAGLAQVLVGHPIDTLKSLVQAYGIRDGIRRIKAQNVYAGGCWAACNGLVNNVVVFNAYGLASELLGRDTPALAGAVAGVAATPAAFCFDGAKILKQVHAARTPLRAVLLGRGLPATLAREAVGFGAYFHTYDRCRRHSQAGPLLSGGLAGLANWTLSFPIDVVRTRQVAHNISAREALRMGKMWHGYPACATRAVVVNSAIFWVYEMCGGNC